MPISHSDITCYLSSGAQRKNLFRSLLLGSCLQSLHSLALGSNSNLCLCHHMAFSLASTSKFPFFFSNIFIYLAVPGLSCDIQDLYPQHANSSQACGTSPLTRGRTWTPCIGSTESQPLDHQRNPCPLIRAILITSSHPQRPCFQMRSYSQVLGVRI